MQRLTLSEARRLSREDVGAKEKTGFINNTTPFVEPRDRDEGRFNTHYQSRYHNNLLYRGKCPKGEISGQSGVTYINSANLSNPRNPRK